MDGNYIDLAEAARRTPGRPHTASIWRWCRRGIKSRSGDRIKLEHVRVGGRIFVKPAALDEFFRAISAADSAHFQSEPVPRPARPTNRQHERSIERAERTLTGAGIL